MTRTYEDTIKRIRLYIQKTLKCSFPLDEYVDNCHIAERFQMVIQVLEFEHLYFDNGLSKMFGVLAASDEHFTGQITEEYQKLRNKHNVFRNAHKRLDIYHPTKWAEYVYRKDTIAARVAAQIKKKRKEANGNTNQIAT